MKKAYLFALAGLLAAAAPALAHPPAANVNFASERGVPFGLVLDGRPLTRGLARQVHVDRLVPGLHWADFTLPTPYGGAVRFRSRVWLEPGLETSFVLLARPGRPLALRQVDAVALCAPSGYGPGRSNDYPGGRYNGPAGYDPAPYDQGSYGSGRNHDNDRDNDYDDADDRPDNGSGAPGYGYPGGPGGNGPGGAGYYPGSGVSSYRTLAPPDVERLLQAVRQRPFDDGKLSLAKEALGQSSIQADDLAQLLRGFSFEASRVELATFAYPHVADRQNFYRVYDAFAFDASAREVQQAVASAPQN